MRIPETVLYSDSLPSCECLLLLPGAVIGSAEDIAQKLLSEAGVALAPEAPVQEAEIPGVPAGHLLAGRAERLDADSPAGVELLKKRLREAIMLADSLGVGEMSFLALPAVPRGSRLFALMTVFFRELMQEREKHPCLEGIRFLCPDRDAANRIAQVYNFYYPAEKSERMAVFED